MSAVQQMEFPQKNLSKASFSFQTDQDVNFGMQYTGLFSALFPLDQNF